MNNLANRSARRLVAFLFLIGILLLHAPHSNATSELANGEYTIDFEILKGDPKDDSTSLANGYWNKPATLIIKNNTLTVRTVINKDAWVTEFSTKQGSSFTETKVISRDTDKDTRLVEFKIGSLKEDLVATMSVDIPSQNYYHSYETRFRFYPDTITPVKLDEPTATEAPALSANDSSKITKEEKATAGSTTTEDRASSSQSSKQDAVVTTKPASGTASGSSADGGNVTEKSGTSSQNSNGASDNKSNSSGAGSNANSVESGNISSGSSAGNLGSGNNGSSGADGSSTSPSSSDTYSKDSSAVNDSISPEAGVTSEVVYPGDTQLSEEAVQSGASQLVEETASAGDASQLLASSEVDVENTSAAILHSEEDKQSGKVTIAIIIVIGVLFVIGSIIWIVRNRKRNNY